MSLAHPTHWWPFGRLQRDYLAILVIAAVIYPTTVTLAGDERPIRQNAVALDAAARRDLFWTEPPEVLSAEELTAVRAAGCATMNDMMESSPSASKWETRRMRPRKRFEIQSAMKREGRKALAISLKQDDQVNSSGKHKHELRIARLKRCQFGEEVWYSFSFHIEGTYPNKGSTRWVIGQWKEESGGSPFLAQRFDNGVFHISIQRNENREIIATAPGNYDEKFLFFSRMFEQSLPFEKGRAPTDFDVMPRAETFGPDAFDIRALKQAIVGQNIKKFPFVADPESYSRIDGVKIEPSDMPVLPNPTTGWVDMRYRVRGDRNGNGLIEVWANQRFIVRVTGKIGNDIFSGPTQYFKIGHYRDVDGDYKESTIYFDRFRRSKNRANVD